MKKSILLLTLFISYSFFCQQKFEKEYRVKADEVPEKSYTFIKTINFKKKVKWFVEESNDGKTFEAKTCHNKYYYSIEFAKNGTLIDVEKKVSLAELDKKVRETIEKHLQDRFKKFKFKKIQIQYKGLEGELKKVFYNETRNKINAKIFFEIVLKGKKEKQYNLFELLFDEQGNFMKELKFAPSNSVNLEF